MSSSNAAKTKPSALSVSRSWVTVVVIGVCCLSASWCVYSLWMAAIEGENRHQCSNNLKLIGYALHQYHAKYGSFPPVCLRDKLGTPHHSWRVLILPFFDHDSVYAKYKFDEPWDGLRNRLLSRESPGFVNWIRPGFYHCWKDSDSDYEYTSYLAVTGAGTAWPNGDPLTLPEVASPGETVAVIEVTISDVKWSEPRDLSVSEAIELAGSNHGDGLHVLMADGSVKHFSHAGIQTNAFEKMLLVAEARGQLEQTYDP